MSRIPISFSLLSSSLQNDDTEYDTQSPLLLLYIHIHIHLYKYYREATIFDDTLKLKSLTPTYIPDTHPSKIEPRPNFDFEGYRFAHNLANKCER